MHESEMNRTQADRAINRWASIALSAWMVAGLIAAPVLAQEATAPQQDTEAEGTETEETAVVVEAVEAVEAVEVEEPDAPEAPQIRIEHYDTSVQIFSGLTVEEDEVYEEAVAILGPLTVHGEVKGDAVAVGGPVEVTGTVGGELVSVGGAVHLGPNAKIGKLVNIGGTLNKEDGAEIRGEVQNVGGGGFSIDIDDGEITIGEDDGERIHKRIDLGHRDRHRRVSGAAHYFGGLAWKLVCTAMLLFLLAVAAVLAPRLIDRAEVKTRVDPWKAAVAGVLTCIGFIPAMVAGVIFLAISIVGILLLPVFIPVMLLALVAGLVVGFAAVSQRVGSVVADRFNWNLGRVPRIAVGAVAIHLISLLGALLSWIPIIGWGVSAIGCLLVFIAWIVGLGALLLAVFDPPKNETEMAQAEDPQSPPPMLPVDPAPADPVTDEWDATESSEDTEE